MKGSLRAAFFCNKKIGQNSGFSEVFILGVAVFDQ